MSGSMLPTSNRIKKERQAKMARSKKLNDRANMYSATQKTKLKFKEVSEDELKKVKVRMKKKIRESKKRTLIWTIALKLIILGIIYFL